MIQSKQITLKENGEYCDRCKGSKLWQSTVSNGIQCVVFLCDNCKEELGIKRKKSDEEDQLFKIKNGHQQAKRNKRDFRE